MKNTAFLSFLLLSLIVSSCKMDKPEFMDKLESVTSGGSNAAEIVAYNNVLIKLSDAQHNYLQGLNRNLNSISKGLQNYNDQFAFMGISPMFYHPVMSYNEPKPEEPGNAFEKEDKLFFEKNVKSLNQSFESIRENYSKLENYIKAEDYKDDQGKVGNQIIQQIDDLVVKYYDDNKIIMNRIVKLSDEAEREVLKTHPFKDHIFAMKDASNLVAKFVTLAYDYPDNYKNNELKFNEMYSEIEKLNGEREKLGEPKNSAYPGKEVYFKTYNNSVNDFLIEARKIMRNANESGIFTDRDLENLARAEENIRLAYNNFVD